MVFFIGDKKYNFSYEELSLSLLSSAGTEGDVYKIGDRAVKMYKPFCKKQRLDDETVEILKNKDTKRILLPIETVYNCLKKFYGYTTKYIRGIDKNKLKLLKMKKLLEEIKLYEEDCRKLTEDNISIADLNIFNIEVDDGIYFCDPGSFKIEKGNNRLNKVLNEEEIRRFFISQIMSRYSNLSCKNQAKLLEYFSYDTYLSDMLEAESFDDDELMTQFVKKIIKKR